MIQRKIQCISMNDKIIGMLEWVSKETQMSKSAVVQELIRKAFNDPKTMEIIQLENLKREIKKKGATSDNVHCVNGQKKGSGRSHLEPEPAADSELLLLNNIRIAKTRWLENNPGEE